MSPPASGPSATSPASATGSSETSLPSKDIELERKRARDRKSQQAMRDRTRWTINNLTEQVALLTRVLDERARDAGLMDSRLRMLEAENAHLRAQNAALQLSLMGSQPSLELPAALQRHDAKMPWEIAPLNSAPTCLSDQILQGFIVSKREQRALLHGSSAAPPDKGPGDYVRPNLISLLRKDAAVGDDISKVVGDVTRSYLEISAMPKKVAVFNVMFRLIKASLTESKP